MVAATIVGLVVYVGVLVVARRAELDQLQPAAAPVGRSAPTDGSARLARMFKVMKKWWKYLDAKLNRNFEQRADPAVQLEQALTESQEQHRRLKEQAANVIASQKQAEIRLNGKMTELEKLNANARQALMMAADAQKAGNADKATQYNSAAETIANQLIQVEKDVEGLKTMVIDSTQASDQAKAAVAQNSRLLQQKLAEKNKLLSQLEQAKMQEEMNKAMAQLNETVGDDVPTLKEVQDKIEARYAKAKAIERAERDVASRAASSRSSRPPPNVEAQSRLSQLRAELGLDGGAAAVAGSRSARPPTPLADRAARASADADAISRLALRRTAAPTALGEAAQTQHDEVVAVDDFVGDVARAARSCACRRRCAARRRRQRHAPGDD